MIVGSRILVRYLVSFSARRCIRIAGCSSVSSVEKMPREKPNTSPDNETVDRTKSRMAAIVARRKKMEEMDEFTREFLKELPKLPDDDELRSVLGSNLIRDPLNKMTIEQMQDECDRTGKEPNKFRKIIYEEGELDNSDLSQPPSSSNPHPFDPSTLPPTHARSLIAYVNHLPVLQRLVDIGIDLFEIDLLPKFGKQLLRMDLVEDVKPRIAFLVREVGINTEDVAPYLNRNPYFLLQNVRDLRDRLKYLRGKNFDDEQVKKIVIANRYWLNTDVKIVDTRLGWLQKQFQLSGNAMRQLIVKEPRLLIFGTGPIKRLLFLFNNDFEFDAAQIKKMLVEDPRLFMMDLEQLKLSYGYLHTTMKITNELIVGYPVALRCPVADIRKRNEFLKRLDLNQYQPELPHYISLRKLLHPNDRYFSETVCRKFLHDYDNFLKTL